MTGGHSLTAAIFVAAGLLVGCGGAVSDPEPGDVEVRTETTGHDPDPDGYTVRLDGVRSSSIATAESVRFSDVAAGNHVVELLGVADHCTVQGDNPRGIAVRTGRTSVVSFSVACEATTGDLRVSVGTTGENPDSTGYVVALDTLRTDSLARNDSTTFRRLPPGSYPVELREVAENCAVQGTNPQTVAVEAGVTSRASFSIDCTAASGDVTAVP